ncbi:hypothetical protein NDR87_25965 [Nocardia sp. CDC159]|uniref:Secreted protein n=1 Tax=Nocardia pulmonis TaxID=2951408 RepID=A0A9X2IX08_9NOCA|nr:MULTISPECIES: hypothetical protein [Nocardia]MCM6774893.1 hypothetical protein [Nocardia pulmonis]MCM6789824.1 hypothetical protein [Nocardia sp. CDC159]
MSASRRLRLLTRTAALCAALLIPAAFATATAANPAAEATTATHQHIAASKGKSEGKGEAQKKGKGKAESDSTGSGSLGATLNGLLGTPGMDDRTSPDSETPSFDPEQMDELGKTLGALANGFFSTFQMPTPAP